MSPLRKIRSLLLALTAVSAHAQTTAPLAVVQRPPAAARRAHTRTYQAPFNPDIILLDPAHGGSEGGAILGSDGEEKKFNLAFATRLQGLLTAQGFTVILTHSDTDNDFSADQRIEIANRSKAVACLVLHASESGHGVHLFTSSLTQPSVGDQGRQDSSIAPWDSAQAASLPRSLQLANELATALNGQKIPLTVARASVTPIDSLVCPAVAIEIAPSPGSRRLSDSPTDTYQQQIASSLVTALGYWRQRGRSQIAAEQAAAAAASPMTAIPATPKPKSKPILIHSPDEVPLEPYNPEKAAPIIRRLPPQTPPRGAR